MLDFKPCRKTELYKIENGKGYIIGFKSIIELNEVAAIFWDMANGKNTIAKIVDYICEVYDVNNKQTVYNDILSIMKQLSKEGILVENWDPLYKSKIILKDA
ncbi:PqqD family protein [Caloranaerobacter ferrireducens]|uniref:PqqD family protein n=1 Tax=Caloranaerobacter ferrireducens TaxID=1323370 RepID=UPI00084CF769|nr:PqqD family protein [Caloranaerobacter ferrireducens]